ncbi:MAG: hypothetical protein V1889_01240 [archaeon]
MGNKKVVAGFELVVMVASVFAFSYLVAVSNEVFGGADVNLRVGGFGRVVAKVVEILGKPIIGIASAESWNETLDSGDILMHTTMKSAFEISSDVFGAGCCAVSKDGYKCATTLDAGCKDGESFAEGSVCDSTSFCKRGCCYDEELGIYDANVLERDCSASWVDDANCNMPGARKGCCVLGAASIYETRGQCSVDSLTLAMGPNAVVDWRVDLNSGQCAMLSAVQEEGACVIGNDCKFVNEGNCFSYGGEFYGDVLCTSPSLNMSCKKTDRTTCVDGKDGVYFVDSCGNVANVYDSKRINDDSYWDVVVGEDDLCGAGDGNAKSKSCGNCNRFLGGICGSASEDGFKVDNGNFYCRSTSCMFDGKSYKNGESWCVYDGVIGDGNDVVGSRHWKYVCSQGVVQIEPCADYRNQICVQTNTFDVEGKEVEFRNSACIANNWRMCLDLNGEENGLEECADSLNCRIDSVAIADHFSFNVCVPKYPGGFNLKSERYQGTAGKICDMADLSCTVVYAPKTWGGCKIVANKGCLSETFAKEMNDFCRGLGDCGGAANIVGEYSSSYKVFNSPMLGQGAIDRLKDLATPIEGQFAEVEDYSEYLEAAGLWGGTGDVPETGELEDYGGMMTNIGMGVAGIGYAVGVIVTGSFHLTGLSYAVLFSSASELAPFAGAAIGAGIGMIAGAMIADAMGLSPGGSLLMAIGGGMVGGIVGYSIISHGAVLLGIPGLGLIIFAAGIILIVTSLFFGGDDCDNVVVRFDCKTWLAPSGGDDCDECNGDLLKPCSEYRCNSLGAACELINKGSDNELCVENNPDDVRPPILKPRLEVISENETYSDISDGGFGLTNKDGGCIDAYTPLMFGVATDEPAHCKFDVEMKEFEEMSFDLGGNFYLYNHTTVFVLPDPSHGQSQGFNWTGDLNFYIKCRDTHGHESPGFYSVDMCVREGEDVTAPIVRAVSPKNGGIVGFNVTSKNVTIVTNELASCKWDLKDVVYSEMGNEMSCLDSLNSPSNIQGYVCLDVLPTMSGDNVYYVRCEDQPWMDSGNANIDSFVYELKKPSKAIEIDWIEPSGDFEINSDMTTIRLQVETSGGGDVHYCSYSFSGHETMIRMFESGGKLHEQFLNRPAGLHKIYVECEDETGDFVRGETSFKIIKDSSTPQVARVWQDDGKLHVVTTEIADCRYSTESCKFNWDDGEVAGNGMEHIFGVVRGDTYYIKCEDEFGNVPSGCSIVVRAL